MSAADTVGPVLQRLKATLATTTLPEKLAASGRTLAARLESPIRLTVMGPPEAGKSTLIKALTLQDTVPDGIVLPTHEFSYADRAKAVVTRSDGSTVTLDGIAFEHILHLEPVFIEFHLPLDVFKRVKLLEVVTDGSAEDMTAATRWAAKRCDIPIWCSRNFSEMELSVWSELPDAQKDHGFMVLTHADQLTPEATTAHLQHVSDTVGDAFRIVAPVAASYALRALRSDREDKEQLVKASGLHALKAELFRHVEAGRQADLDHAELFLERFERSAVAKSSAAASKPTLTPSTPRVSSKALEEVADHLHNQAHVMLTDIEEFGSFAPKKIVERCLETANQLVDMVADEDPMTPLHETAFDAATEAADVLLLMTLENTKGAAEDALSLLLQVKRDFEVAAAA